jgi:hypothetical protein
VDFAKIAAGCGIERTYDFSDLCDWTSAAPDVLSKAGPVFVRLAVQPVVGQRAPTSPCPIKRQIARLQQALDVVR